MLCACTELVLREVVYEQAADASAKEGEGPAVPLSSLPRRTSPISESGEPTMVSQRVYVSRTTSSDNTSAEVHTWLFLSLPIAPQIQMRDCIFWSSLHRAVTLFISIPIEMREQITNPPNMGSKSSSMKQSSSALAYMLRVSQPLRRAQGIMMMMPVDSVMINFVLTTSDLYMALVIEILEKGGNSIP